MTRTPDEWHGKNDDAAIPARVQDRVSQKSNDCCVTCTRPVVGKLRAEIDHVIPLILGGKHRETNLQLLCHECHGAKTRRDVKIKAKVARVRKRHLGINTRRGPKIQSPGFRKSAPQRTASRPIERRT